MSLSITSTNILTGVTPVVTDGAIGAIPTNVVNPDHSLTLSSGIAVADFSISFGSTASISYLAISGHDAATPANATIQLFNDVTLIDSVALTRNNNVMFTFNAQTFTDLIVKFVTVPNTFVTTVSYIASGLVENPSSSPMERAVSV